MDQYQTKRYNRALKEFSGDFLRVAKTDRLANAVFFGIVNGNAFNVIEQLVNKVNEQQSTIDNLVDTYCKKVTE